MTTHLAPWLTKTLSFRSWFFWNFQNGQKTTVETSSLWISSLWFQPIRYFHHRCVLRIANRSTSYCHTRALEATFLFHSTLSAVTESLRAQVHLQFLRFTPLHHLLGMRHPKYIYIFGVPHAKKINNFFCWLMKLTFFQNYMDQFLHQSPGRQFFLTTTP